MDENKCLNNRRDAIAVFDLKGNTISHNDIFTDLFESLAGEGVPIPALPVFLEFSQDTKFEDILSYFNKCQDSYFSSIYFSKNEGTPLHYMLSAFKANNEIVLVLKEMGACTVDSDLEKLVTKITSTLNLDEVLDMAIYALRKVFNFSGYSINVIDGDLDKKLKVLRFDIPGLNKDTREFFGSAEFDLNTESGLIVVPVFENKDVFVEKPEDAIKYGMSAYLYMENLGIKSQLLIPLKMDARTIGVIAFYAKDDVHIKYEPALLARIKKYINPISIAINNSFLLTRIVDHAFMLEKKVSERTKELRKKNDELELLNNVTQKINSTLDLNEVLDLIHEELSMLFYFEGFGVMLADETRSYLTTIKLEIPSLDREMLGEFFSKKIPLAFGAGGRVAASVLKKEDYYFENINLDNIKSEINREAVIKTGGVKSALIIPIILSSEAIGTMIFASYTKNLGYTKSDIQTLKRFVAQASNAIKNSFLHRDLQRALEKLDNANMKLRKQKRLLKELSVTDSLTNVKNRRYFDERMTEEFEKSSRYSKPVYIILMDIDNFKSVNDTYGHDCGDFVLVEFANIVKDNIRKSDLFARYGGEEFIIAMFETNMEGAKLVAEKIRSAAESHVYVYKNISVKRTVSIGISCFPSPDSGRRNAEGFINEADEALYVAKNTGKNKWIYYYDYKRKELNILGSDKK